MQSETYESPEILDTTKAAAADDLPDEPADADSKDAEGENSATDALKIYLKDVYRSRLLSAEEERELARRVAQNDPVARERMIHSNLRLVVRLAKRYLHRGLPLLDLIEEGNVGLIKAVDRFDVEKGFRFSTYGTYWIRQSIERALVNFTRTIRLPVHISDEISTVVRADRDLRSTLNREPTREEIARLTGFDPDHVEDLLRLNEKTYSIEHPMGEDEDLQLVDVLKDEGATRHVERTEEIQEFSKINGWIQELSEQEQIILKLRFGLEDLDKQTLETVGKKFGVTRERIRQLEKGSLKKLKKRKQQVVDLLTEEEELPGPGEPSSAIPPEPSW